ncbi:MAG: glycosyltransferase family 39 protein [Chloroflexi bacterium]|nr:glycosyltransferase family 39 protein [Chloroflexota bacterium]
MSTRTQNIARIGVLALILFLAFYNLTEFPPTWFDEGSHLHVPKTLVRFGVYADYSSEGFRHFGPTMGVGPTVLLPIAGVFKLFGIGLLQARVVMAVYLLAMLCVFYQLARNFGDAGFAAIATGLLITSRAVDVSSYGRQVLGEIPGLFFLVCGLVLWFRAWEKAGWLRLLAVGGLLGLAAVTKYQYLVALAPALLITWVLNLVYYRAAPQRVFLVPGILTALVFGAWQLYLLVYLGPSTIAENFVILREATAGAALVFSPDLMLRSLAELLSLKVYLLALIPALLYGVRLVLPRDRAGQQWGAVWALVAVNLVWYVFASVSWLRYAFLGLAFSSLFVARFFADLTRGLNLAAWRRAPFARDHLWRGAMAVWLAGNIVIPLALDLREIVFPPPNHAAAMAQYLNAHVPLDALIETWEPEMGLLTDHNYHYPPPSYLPKAVGYIWLDQPGSARDYDFLMTHSPPFVLVGEFATWVQMYPPEALARYTLVTSFGAYELYEIKK